jgi:site-specific DNA-adenine methylase
MAQVGGRVGNVTTFWNYFGGKYRIAPHYPLPAYQTIVEPFAGAAGYSLRYWNRNVILIEKNPVIVGVWRYLISAKPQEIMDIPPVTHVDDLPSWVPQEARWLVGFNMNQADVKPGRYLTPWSNRPYHGWPHKREKIASQVGCVRHWRVIEGSYHDSPNIEATWFVDPPYQLAGKMYVFGSDQIDYQNLAEWCKARKGQTMVCENMGAAWLPFRPFKRIRGTMKPSIEAIWTNS